MDTLAFWKMHGAGNDFVVAESDAPDYAWGPVARAVCDRHFGVGADGLILVLPSDAADRRMRMFNPDGSEAEMCGNGLRCFVKYSLERASSNGGPAADVSAGSELSIETAVGVLQARVIAERDGLIERVRVSIGEPSTDPRASGVDRDAAGELTRVAIEIDDPEYGSIDAHLVSMGNPHAVAFIDSSVEDFPLHRVGPLIEHHPMFANRTNFEIVSVAADDSIRVRVWERGAGETLACGSGACATAVASRLLGYVGDSVTVTLPGGDLQIDWDGAGEVFLTGPAEHVFSSEWELS